MMRHDQQAASERAKKRKVAAAAAATGSAGSTPSASEHQDKLNSRRINEASCALAEATIGCDLDVLAAAIDLASAVGVNGVLVASATRRKLALEAEQRESQQAQQLLLKAVAGTDVGVITDAIMLAENCGVPMDVILNACQRKADLLRDAQFEQDRQKRREESSQKLQEAIQASDVKKLELAISQAAYAGVPEEIIRNAVERKSDIEKELNATIGLGQHQKQKAVQAQKLGIRGSKRSKHIRSAEANLEAAILQGDSVTLSSAIKVANNVGSSLQIIECAQRKLADVMQYETRYAHEAAVQALETAIQESNLEALLKATTVAMQVGVDCNLLYRAVERRTALEQELRNNLVSSAVDLASAEPASMNSSLDKSMNQST